MNNTYGTVRPANINIANDVEVWYHFRPTRSTEDSNFTRFKRLEPTSVLQPAVMSEDDITDGIPASLLTGMYNLMLPASVFARKGFYTVYIKPREIPCEIYDVGALAAYPDVVGIVLNKSSIKSDLTLFDNDALVGYRVEYFDANTGERTDYYRIVTSNNTASPVSQNLTNANMNSNGYRYNDSGNLVFLTLTPSTSPSFKATEKPYIGIPNQKISITNTKFDPVCLEIEICAVDFDTLDVSINGSQIRSLENSVVSTYNENGELTVQHSYYTVKNNYTNKEVMDVKKRITDNFDFSVDANEILNQ